VVAATMSKLGVILKRTAGSSGRFAEHAGLPTDLDGGDTARRPKKSRPAPKKGPIPKVSEEAARNAAAEFEKEQRRREAERRREEEAARAKERETNTPANLSSGSGGWPWLNLHCPRRNMRRAANSTSPIR